MADWTVWVERLAEAEARLVAYKEKAAAANAEADDIEAWLVEMEVKVTTLT